MIKLYLKFKEYLFFIIFFIFIILLIISYIKTNENILELKLIKFIKDNRKNTIKKRNFENQISSIKKYIKLLRQKIIKIHNFPNLVDNPKISFITSVYNNEKYLYSFTASIQNQLLKDFELIFVDDCSFDKSIKLIMKYIIKDKRIKLLKNKKNMGSLYTRYIGSIYSKGEYFIFADSDDIILKYGIINAYKYIKNNNLDMVEFHSIFENKNGFFINRRHYNYENIIYQPILSYIYYYKNKQGFEYNTALWNKLIKKKVVIKSFNYIGLNYLKKKIIIENDVIILFSFFRKSKSFQFIDEIGYLYNNINKNSITSTKYKPFKANQVIYSIFINIKFLFEKTYNTYLDKYFCIFKLKQGYHRYKRLYKYLNKEFKLIENILNNLLFSKFISLKNKLFIFKLKKEILFFSKLNI